MNPTHPGLTTRISPDALREFLGGHRWDEVREAVRDWPTGEVAELLLELDHDERVLFFRALPRRIATDTFAHLSGERREALLDALTNDETREVLTGLTPDDRAALVAELPAVVTQELLALMTPEDRDQVRTLLGYPEDSVGRLMTPEYVAVRPEWTVEEALAHVRRVGRDAETVNRIYVVDDQGRLIDDIRLRSLVLAPEGAHIQDVMDHAYVSVSAFADREQAVEAIRRYDVIALPVLDSDGVLLGIVTVDDLLDVAEKEATEDFHRVASVAPLETSLRDAGLGLLYRRRIGWLLILVLVNVFSGAGIAYFEDVIAATVALVFFLPLLIDSSGNAGSQSATLVVRAMATGDVHARDWLLLVRRELSVALLMGLTMAVAVSVMGVYRGGAEVAVVVSLTMIALVVTGSLVGISLPFLLHRFGMDPATASAPLVTSIADITGVLIYFSLASWYLSGM
jgi:magnesium transporter